MERIYVFLPSILIIACIAGVTFLYCKWIIRRFGDDWKSVKWHKENEWKVIWTVGTPMTYVHFPALEELIFRAPLIIAFDAISGVAWYGIFVSSTLFALIHLFGKKIWMLDILSEQKNGGLKTDDVETEIDRLHQEYGRMIMVRKVMQVVFTLILGILAGYYGIKYQSIWVSVGIHAAWNILMPAIMPIVLVLLLHLTMSLFTSLFRGISSLRKRVECRQRRFG